MEQWLNWQANKWRQVGTRIGSWFELSAFSDGRSMQMPWIFQAWSRRHRVDRVDTSTKDNTHCIMSATRSSLTSGLGEMPLVISHNLDCQWSRSNMILNPQTFWIFLDPSLLASWSNGSNGFNDGASSPSHSREYLGILAAGPCPLDHHRQINTFLSLPWSGLAGRIHWRKRRRVIRISPRNSDEHQNSWDLWMFIP